MTRNRGLAGFASAISGPVNIPDLNVGVITATSGNITGNFGIGTDNPGFDFHLFRTGDTTLVIESDRPNTDEDANPKLIFRQDGGIDASAIGMNFDSDGTGNDLFIANSISLGSIRFLTGTSNGYTNATERMRIDSSGNLGIGTDNPSLKLEVAGSAAFSNNVGIQTDNITRGDLVGAGNSFVGMYIGDGFLAFSTSLSRSDGYYISTSINALNAGPVTLGSTMTIDGTWVIV